MSNISKDVQDWWLLKTANLLLLLTHPLLSLLSLYYISPIHLPLYLSPLPSLLLLLHLHHPSHLPHTASVLGLAPLGPCTKRERARSQRSSLSIQAVMGILTRRLCTANRFNTGQGIIKQDAGRANNQVRE